MRVFKLKKLQQDARTAALPCHDQGKSSIAPATNALDEAFDRRDLRDGVPWEKAAGQSHQNAVSAFTDSDPAVNNAILTVLPKSANWKAAWLEAAMNPQKPSDDQHMFDVICKFFSAENRQTLQINFIHKFDSASGEGKFYLFDINLHFYKGNIIREDLQVLSQQVYLAFRSQLVATFKEQNADVPAAALCQFLMQELQRRFGVDCIAGETTKYRLAPSAQHKIAVNDAAIVINGAMTWEAVAEYTGFPLQNSGEGGVSRLRAEAVLNPAITTTGFEERSAVDILPDALIAAIQAKLDTALTAKFSANFRNAAFYVRLASTTMAVGFTDSIAFPRHVLSEDQVVLLRRGYALHFYLKGQGMPFSDQAGFKDLVQTAQRLNDLLVQQAAEFEAKYAELLAYSEWLESFKQAYGSASDDAAKAALLEIFNQMTSGTLQKLMPQAGGPGGETMRRAGGSANDTGGTAGSQGTAAPQPALQIQLRYFYHHDHIATLIKRDIDGLLEWIKRLDILENLRSWLGADAAASETDLFAGLKAKIIVCEHDIDTRTLPTEKGSLGDFLKTDHDDEETHPDGEKLGKRILLIPVNTGWHWELIVVIIDDNNALMAAFHIDSGQTVGHKNRVNLLFGGEYEEFNYGYEKIKLPNENVVTFDGVSLLRNVERFNVRKAWVTAAYQYANPTADADGIRSRVQSYIASIQTDATSCGPFSARNATIALKYLLLKLMRVEPAFLQGKLDPDGLVVRPPEGGKPERVDIRACVFDQMATIQLRALHCRMMMPGGVGTNTQIIASDFYQQQITNGDSRVDHTNFFARQNTTSTATEDAAAVIQAIEALLLEHKLLIISALSAENNEDPGPHLNRLRNAIRTLHAAITAEGSVYQAEASHLQTIIAILFKRHDELSEADRAREVAPADGELYLSHTKLPNDQYGAIVQHFVVAAGKALTNYPDPRAPQKVLSNALKLQARESYDAQLARVRIALKLVYAKSVSIDTQLAPCRIILVGLMPSFVNLPEGADVDTFIDKAMAIDHLRLKAMGEALAPPARPFGSALSLFWSGFGKSSASGGGFGAAAAGGASASATAAAGSPYRGGGFGSFDFVSGGASGSGASHGSAASADGSAPPSRDASSGRGDAGFTFSLDL